MSKKRARKLSMTVDSRTFFHLNDLSKMEHMSVGRVVDKLVREKMLSMKGGFQSCDHTRKKSDGITLSK